MFSNKNYSPELLNLAQGDSLLARLLVNRGVETLDAAKYFLDLKSVKETSPLEIPEMDKAFERIKSAIKNKERILVFGDYDVDGTSSVALLYRAFGIIGVEIEYYVPSRHSEGYGLNSKALQSFKESGIDLVITCDCGISNYDEVAFANSINLDVIVTDHHSIPANPPPGIANCNPKTLPEDHPLHYLPGVGVAYKLAELLLHEFTDDGAVYARSLLDLVALGMVADMAPLLAENRYLTIEGLKVLARTDKPGLRELMRVSGLRVSAGATNSDEESIGFGLAPRINAAGRLADATRAVRLMITEDLVEANELCHELDAENKERQKLCSETYEEALSLIDEDRSMLEDNVIVLAKEGWHHGVIGIVASRLLETFHLPVFIMAIEKDSNLLSKSSDAKLASSEQAELTSASMFRGSTHLSESINAESPDTERIIDNDSFSKKDECNAVDGALKQGSVRGSVRCINVPGLDIYEEMKVIQADSSLFLKYGGHKMAAGFSVEPSKLEALKLAIRKRFKERLAEENTSKRFKMDAALRLDELDRKFISRLGKLAPYGIDNPQAKFVSGPVRIERMKILGQEEKHLKLFLVEEVDGKKSRVFEAVIWNRAQEFLEIYPLNLKILPEKVHMQGLRNDDERSLLDVNELRRSERNAADETSRVGSKPEICIVYTPKLNEFMGEVSIQLDIRDWKSPGDTPEVLFNRFHSYSKPNVLM